LTDFYRTTLYAVALCPSVRLSVRHKSVYSVKMAELRITQRRTIAEKI